MGWLSVIICGIPLYLLYDTGQPVLWAIALVNTLANVWSYGVMHNYAVEDSAQKIRRLQANLEREGRIDANKQAEIDKIPLVKDLRAVPGWLTNINLATFLIGLGFVAYCVWQIFKR